MRLDKFLKVSRLIKRRTVAKDACTGGRVEVNGRPAKPGTEVRTGDQITLHFGSRELSVRVVSTPDNAKAQQAAECYEVINDISHTPTPNRID